MKHRAVDRRLIDTVIQSVCMVYKLNAAALYGRGRSDNVSEARMMAMFLVQKHTQLSLTEIGRMFCRRHSTVLHALRRINELAQIYPAIVTRYQRICINIEYIYTHKLL